MHLTSPTVRMFDQIATQAGAKDVTCDAFVSIASRKICDNDALRDILKSYNQYDVVSYLIHIYLNPITTCIIPLLTVWFLVIPLPKDKCDM